MRSYKHIFHKLATLCHIGNTSFNDWAALKTSDRCLELAITDFRNLSDRVSERNC